MLFTAAWLAIGNMLTHWSLNFLELVERFFWDKPEHTVSLLTFELAAVEQLANSLSGKIKNPARFRDGVEFIGNHSRHALILTAINMTVKFRCPPQKCDVLNTGEPGRRAAYLRMFNSELGLTLMDDPYLFLLFMLVFLLDGLYEARNRDSGE